MTSRRSTRSRGGAAAPPSPDVPDDADEPTGRGATDVPTTCWLCARPLGRRVEWHHPKPKSRGGRLTVPVHPICHRTIHACFTNAELDRMSADETPLSADPKMGAFLTWISGKPPDFHAPTRGGRR